MCNSITRKVTFHKHRSLEDDSLDAPEHTLFDSNPFSSSVSNTACFYDRAPDPFMTDDGLRRQSNYVCVPEGPILDHMVYDAWGLSTHLVMAVQALYNASLSYLDIHSHRALIGEALEALDRCITRSLNPRVENTIHDYAVLDPQEVADQWQMPSEIATALRAIHWAAETETFGPLEEARQSLLRYLKADTDDRDSRD